MTTIGRSGCRSVHLDHLPPVTSEPPHGFSVTSITGERTGAEGRTGLGQQVIRPAGPHPFQPSDSHSTGRGDRSCVAPPEAAPRTRKQYRDPAASDAKPRGLHRSHRRASSRRFRRGHRKRRWPPPCSRIAWTSRRLPALQQRMPPMVLWPGGHTGRDCTCSGAYGKGVDSSEMCRSS